MNKIKAENTFSRVDTSNPKFASGEGLMNALINRDFSTVSSNAHVAFFPTHLEIINTGSLFGRYTPNDLSKSYLSVPLKHEIADRQTNFGN